MQVSRGTHLPVHTATHAANLMARHLFPRTPTARLWHLLRYARAPMLRATRRALHSLAPNTPV
eukprot:7925994-Alexandrium_andersonii.AAC.1